MSSVILTLTIGSQVARQWRSHDPRGVSPWLFVGQITASIGFVAYSAWLGDAVFVTINAVLLVLAVAGLAILVRDRRAMRRGEGPQ